MRPVCNNSIEMGKEGSSKFGCIHKNLHKSCLRFIATNLWSDKPFLLTHNITRRDVHNNEIYLNFLFDTISKKEIITNDLII